MKSFRAKSLNQLAYDAIRCEVRLAYDATVRCPNVARNKITNQKTNEESSVCDQCANNYVAMGWRKKVKEKS